MKPIQTAGVIGLGSLGVLYATLFTRALGKEQVPVLADGARIARYRKQGFWYNDAPCDFNYTDAAARTEPVDLLLFAVKFGGLQNAIETCRHLVGPDTLLISVLNGISSEEILGDAFGPEHVVWCVAERMAAKKEGNRVVCDPIGELAVGVPAGEDPSRLQRLTAFFDSIGFPYVVPADIRTHMWSKLLCNTGCNQAALVFQCDYGPLQVPGKPRDTMIGAMREVAAVANAEGVPLSEKDVAAWVDIIDHLPSNGETSMRQDGKNHRKRSGAVCRHHSPAGRQTRHFRPCQRLAVPADPGDGAELLSLSSKGTSAGLLSCTPMIPSRCLRTGTLESPGTKGPGHLFISVSAPAGSAGGSAAGTRFRTGKSAPPWRQGWPAPDGTESCPPPGSPAAPPAAGPPGPRPFLAP